MKIKSFISLAFALPLLAGKPFGSLDQLPNPAALPVAKLAIPRPQPQTFTLPNGLRTVFMENHELPVVMAVIYARVGELDSPIGKGGLATMAANMFRRCGTEKHTDEQVEEILASLGAKTGVKSGKENSFLVAQCLKQDAPTVFGIFGQILADPRFRKEKIESLRNQMLSEIRQKEEDPVSLAMDRLQQVLFNNKGMGVQSSLESVQSITEEDLRHFISTWFRPGNLVVALAGDLSSAEARTLMANSFGHLQDSPVPTQNRVTEATQIKPGVTLVEKAKATQSAIAAGMQGLKEGDPDQEALSVAFHVLGEGMQGRLFQSIRTREGLAYVAQGGASFPNTTEGMFYGLTLASGQHTAKAARLMREEMRRLAKDGITAQELKSTKDAIVNSGLFENQTSFATASSAALRWLFKQPLDLSFMKLEKIQALTLEQVNAAIKRRFMPEELRMVVVGDPAVLGTLQSDMGA